jgi:ribulose-phosphate 3-epimerase
MVSDVRITPSILNADFSQLNSEIKKISEVADLLHLDVMDNVFVPNFTFDFEAASKIIEESTLAVDAHLMVADVDEIAVQYAEIGCASVTIHAEATRNIGQTLKNIRAAGSRASLGIKPGTEIDPAILEDELFQEGIYVSGRNDFRGYKSKDATLYHNE